MAKTIRLDELGAAIANELTIYHEDVTKRVNELSENAVKELVKKTKATAPKASGSFKKNIAGKVLEKSPNGDKYVWFVKPPDHRITHLLVHGHATRNGGRTKANPFLKNALDAILPKYEREVEEAVKK
jgi:hypothetical protein